jgi:hypothetical protein
MNGIERRIEELKKQILEQEEILRDEKRMKNILSKRFDKLIKGDSFYMKSNLTNQKDLINLKEDKNKKKQ